MCISIDTIKLNFWVCAACPFFSCREFSVPRSLLVAFPAGGPAAGAGGGRGGRRCGCQRTGRPARRRLRRRRRRLWRPKTTRGHTRWANAAAAPPATAGGPERAGTDQPAILASMWSNMLLTSTSGKPKGCGVGMDSRQRPAASMLTSQDSGIPSNVHEWWFASAKGALSSSIWSSILFCWTIVRNVDIA